MVSWSLEYAIDVDEEHSVVYVKIHGRWRAETAERYHEDFKRDVAPLLGKPWAKLVDLTSWKTSRDEVTVVVGKHLAWSTQNKVNLSLYVIDNPSTYRQLGEMFTKGRAGEGYHTFRTMQQAQAFLKENWLDKPQLK